MEVVTSTVRKSAAAQAEDGTVVTTDGVSKGFEFSTNGLTVYAGATGLLSVALNKTRTLAAAISGATPCFNDNLVVMVMVHSGSECVVEPALVKYHRH